MQEYLNLVDLKSLELSSTERRCEASVNKFECSSTACAEWTEMKRILAKLIARNPPGGFLLGRFQDEESGGRGPHEKTTPIFGTNLGLFFRGGPLPPYSSFGNHQKKNTPWGGEFLSIKVPSCERQEDVRRQGFRRHDIKIQTQTEIRRKSSGVLPQKPGWR